MADSIINQIYAYEDNILNAIGSFIRTVIQMPVYLSDKPFVAPTTPYATVRIITSGDSKGWGQRYTYEDGKYSYIIDNTYTVEIMCCRGRPMPTLGYLLSAFMSFEELKYEQLYVKGVSFLSASNISEANTLMDGDKTQLRGRMVLTFNTRMITEDIPTTELTDISITVKSYRDDYTDTIPVVTRTTLSFPIGDYIENAEEQYRFINNDGLPENEPSTWINGWTT